LEFSIIGLRIIGNSNSYFSNRLFAAVILLFGLPWRIKIDINEKTDSNELIHLFPLPPLPLKGEGEGGGMSLYLLRLC
jgi:hypothetical protein